jgi:chorismate lyase/3-hydroxybenzoate synthase
MPTARRGDAALAPPAWTRKWVGDEATIVSQRVAGARSLGAADFKQRVAEAYSRVLDDVARSRHRHIVRMWNHLPGIHDGIDRECDRYMIFNAARYHVLADALGGEAAIAKSAPAASGVGHEGDDFVVHALAVAEPGIAVENPLQVPAYRYSKRYGPIPPCFARATRIEKPQPALLIAGTAAIAGEQSQFPDDLKAQFELTTRNLRVLIHRGSSETIAEERALDRMNEVRIYSTSAVDVRELKKYCGETFSTRKIEFVRADLCRADLLVEIEGFVPLEK